MAGPSRVQQYWSSFDDAELLAIAATTLSDLRSSDARRRDGAHEQLQELQTELRRRGVWREKSSAC
jgi:hypothetical protein